MWSGGGAWPRLESGLVSLSFSRSQPSAEPWEDREHDAVADYHLEWRWRTRIVEGGLLLHLVFRWQGSVVSLQVNIVVVVWSPNKFWGRRGEIGGLRCLLQSELGQLTVANQLFSGKSMYYRVYPSNKQKQNWKIDTSLVAIGAQNLFFSLYKLGVNFLWIREILKMYISPSFSNRKKVQYYRFCIFKGVSKLDLLHSTGHKSLKNGSKSNNLGSLIKFRKFLAR